MDFEVGDYVEYDRKAEGANIVDKNKFGKIYRIKDIVDRGGVKQLIFDSEEGAGHWFYRFKLVRKGKARVFKDELKVILEEN